MCSDWNTKIPCGTLVEGFALKLLSGVWNTPDPAIPKRICVFGMVFALFRAKTASAPAKLRREKRHPKVLQQGRLPKNFAADGLAYQAVVRLM